LQSTISLLTFLVFFSPLHAQKNIGNLFVKNEDRGDRMFLDLYYEQAVIYYKMAVKNKDNNNLVKLKLANSKLVGYLNFKYAICSIRWPVRKSNPQDIMD